MIGIVLSAAVVALALVAQTGSDGDLTLFAVVLLPVVLFPGIATFYRLGAINQEDGRLVVGMNRLRRSCRLGRWTRWSRTYTPRFPS